MTAATLSRLPLAAGEAFAGSLARGVAWTLARASELGQLGLAQFMRAPIAITCVAAITGFSILAGSNALFLQTERHPAPLFFSTPNRVAVASGKPVIPAVRPRPLPAAIDEETTGSVGSHPVGEPIGNQDVRALQEKLAALSLFDGAVDGLFGRRTATAIKAFEIKVGMKPTGKLTRELVAAVLAAPAVATGVTPAGGHAVASASLKPQPADAKPVATVALNTPVPLAPHRLPAASPVASPAATSPAASATQTAGLASNPSVLPRSSQQASADVPATATIAAPSIAPAAASVPVVQVANAIAVAPAPAVASDADGAVMAMNSPSTAAKPVATAPVSAGATPAQKLAAQMGTLPPSATPVATASVVPPAATSSDPGEGAGSTDPVLITKIQRGLASLGFLGAKIDGVPGEGTAKAIRNFEVFYDYKVTGLATPQLLNLLIQHGAVI
ncbi:MAG: peptidoglycan-binding domain-containing protein [Devosia sp.]|nr:peptidoglycan-binding domain-containing protein [Devosia sp.]